MALTNTELFGENVYYAVGQVSGGSVKILAVPDAIISAGPLAVVAWLLDRLVQAQVADGGSPGVVTRSVTELSNGKTRMIYNVTLTADTADLTADFAVNVDDNFA